MSTVAESEVKDTGKGVSKVIDALVHPIAPDRQLREHLAQPWPNYPIPKPLQNAYPPPFGEYHPEIEMAEEPNPPAGDGLGDPGVTKVITPEMVERDILARGVSTAVLLPLTRGIQPDSDFDSAISAATNEWLAARWLGDGNQNGRFKGTIRVNPRDPDRAAAEIRKWADHPHMVQVGVPLQATAPYGDRFYWPVWAAAAEAGLPIVVHADTGSGIEPAYSVIGAPLTTYAMHVLQPLNGVIHLASLVAQGVFARYPGSVWVFADGAYSAYHPIFWRFNNEWREARFQTPWVEKKPSDFLSDHVRFVFRSDDTNQDGETLASALELSHADELLMFGSGYPFWDRWVPNDAQAVLPERFAEPVLRSNAQRLYRLADN